jgi:hypothetical protein
MATTANIDVDAGGLLVIDGVQTAVGDRILVKDQTDGSENGIRTASEGQWYRAADARTARTLQKGTTVHVAEGTTNGAKTFVFNTLNPVIGDSALDIDFYISDTIVDDVNDAVSAGLASISTAASDGVTAVNAAVTAAGFPASPAANSFLQRNAGNTAYDAKTPGQTMDAVSPATTRGDIIFRNATTMARLGATTAGYLLQTGGAGADPSWVGFLQGGTGASTRTWQDKARERISVKDFGATGDGVTDDTAAIQAAETYRASVAGELVFPPGTYQISATSVTVNRASGGAWRGVGQAMLRASANNAILCVLTSAVAGTTNKSFLVTGLHFHGGGFTGVRGVHETSPYGTTIENCTFTQMYFCASFIGNSVLATQTGWIQISNIRQYGGGSWAFYSFDNTTYLFHIELNNIHQVGTGSAANWENAFWIEGRRAVGLSINNCWSGSLDGGADGLLLRGDCQGVFVTNSTFVWPKIGINALTWTDTLKPAYVYMSNIGVDQHVTSAAEIEGRTWFITNVNFANGYVRTNTGQACLLKSTCTDIVIQNALFAYDQKSGLVVQNGAKKIRVGNFTAENNNQVAGANYEVDLGASPFADVRLFGKNVIGAAGTNATGQRLVNGITSNEVSRNTGSASTTAVTTTEDLMTYTIPANTFQPGQKVRLTAWGTTAANANTKTIRLWLGANSIADHNGTWNAIPWRMTADIFITGASAQEYSSVVFASANSPTIRQGTLTVTDTATIVVKATGQNGTASAADITCQGFTVEILD